MSTKPAPSSIAIITLAIAVVVVLVFLVGGELKTFLSRPETPPAADTPSGTSGAERSGTPAPPRPGEGRLAPKPATPAGDSVVTGVVKGEDGAPLAGASIVVMSADGGGDAVATAITDAEGRFSVPSSGTGLAVRASFSGLVPVSEQRVQPGRPLEFRLEKGGSLTGTIRAAEGGTPVAGAQVFALARSGGTQSFSESVTSDASGKFTFDVVPSRPVSLRIEAPGFEPTEERGVRVMKGQTVTRDVNLRAGLTIRGEVVDGDTRKPVPGAQIAYGLQSIAGKREVAADQNGSFVIPGIARGQQLFVVKAPGYMERRKSVELGDDPSVVLELFKGRLLRGRVTDRAGAAVADAIVFIAREGVFIGPQSKPAATSDADGRFSIPDLDAAQSYRLIVRHERYPETLSPEISLASADATEITVTLSPGGAIGGTVKDATGKPIPGARVVVVDAFNQDPVDPQNLLPAFGGSGRGNGTSGEDGRYLVQNLSIGKKRVSVSAEGFLPSQIEEASVEEGTTPTTLDFVLDRGKGISGKVTDPLGKPVDGAKVNATGTNPEAPGFGSATTLEDGTYRIDRLVDGTFNVSVRKTGFTVEFRKDVPSGSEGIDFSLRRNGSVAGTVVEAASNAPIRQFMVRVSEMVPSEVPANKAKAFNSEEGRFVLDEIRPGQYRVEVTAKGFAPATIDDVAVAEGAGTEGLRLALKEGGVVEGSVTDLSGAPIARATVFARLFEDEAPATSGGRAPVASATSATTDEEGHYRIAGLLSDDYEVYASAPAYCLSSRERVRADDGRSVKMDFRLSMGSTLTVVVADKDGNPVKEAKVELRDDRGEPVYNERIRQVIERYRQDPEQLESFLSRLDRTDRSGQVRFTNFPPGDYRIHVTTAGGGESEKRVSLREKDELREEIVIADGR